MLSPLKGTPLPIGAAINDEGGGQYAAGSSLSIPRPLSPSSQALRSRPRKSVAGVIFCAGGRGTGGDPFRSVEAFDCRLNRWISICEMTQQRRHVGVVSALGKLKKAERSFGNHSVVILQIDNQIDPWVTPNKV
ncbi:unnamed protein product [Nippostrongylus brasiliensis]|uniref:Kelch repeat-containing F-box family protein n=1 Tax=Nippostrongylus brasiliensis TaxID=27835 RepID=A0A0N4XSE0_NIPBR|nr:unnamed protein product [Nippostrongylus brasiliensis]